MGRNIKCLVLILLLSSCSKNISFNPTTTIGKELIKFLYLNTEEYKKIIKLLSSEFISKYLK
jgi:hypothetical protein